VEVGLVPGIEATYDVTLVLDGEAGAFSCVTVDAWWGWEHADVVGAANVWDCSGEGFALRGAPQSVEIAVNAEDGSWNGSLMTSPTYELNQPNGPDCPPTCRFARLTVSRQLNSETKGL
jgi:hypothetical protein